MSEKVVLTHEQAEAIEQSKKSGMSDAEIMVSHFNYTDFFESKDTGLDTTDKLARALFLGYEVERPEFKEGDMVVTNWENATDLYILHAPYPEINDLKAGKGWRLIGHNYGIQEKNIRHATPEEIFWLHDLGRKKVPDFHEGDVLLHENGVSSPIYGDPGIYLHRTTIESAEIAYQNCDVKGIYPAESFKPFRKDEAK